MQERIFYGDLYINGNLIIDGFSYIYKGNLTVGGTIIVKNGSLVVEGDLLIHSRNNRDVYFYNSSVNAKSITAKTNINIFIGNISTFKDLTCENIGCYGGDISVGGNSKVKSVFCRNYLVDGKNDSLDIEAENTVYIMDFSNSLTIAASEVFLGGGGDFGGGLIIADEFDFDGHVYNCLKRDYFSKKSS